MIVRTSITEGPLPTAAPANEPVEGGGALLVFDGIVRLIEDGKPLSALLYEAYQPMASRQLERLARDIAEAHGLLLIDARHSTGRVPTGAVSFRLTIGARHRKEALAAMDDFIDRLKRDVPIWKKPEWASR
jgi:molybdopterin synthase catalytic subunit